MMNDKYKASCPVCGRNLFRGARDSYLEGHCPKCKNFLKMYFIENGVTVTVAEQDTVSQVKTS